MEDLAKGAVEGFFEHWEEKIPELVKKLQNREIAFVQNKEAFQIIRKEADNAEFKLFKQFAPKGWPRILFKLGLAMREVERNQDAIQELKDDIYRKFGKDGVHFAELAQRGIITELVSQLAKLWGNQADVSKRLKEFTDQVGELAIFVSKEQMKEAGVICERVKRRIDAAPSRMVIVFGSGYAKNVVTKILRCVREDPESYAVETKDEGFQLVLFVYSAELRGKLRHWTEPFTA